jgi:hypothetical protein
VSVVNPPSVLAFDQLVAERDALLARLLATADSSKYDPDVVRNSE